MRISGLSSGLSIIAILAAAFGGILTTIAFHRENAPAFLIYSTLPGTIAALLISGGESGSTPIAEAIAPFAAGLVNMIFYSLVVIGIVKICRIFIPFKGVTHDHR
jgi:hypothetical protein